MFIENQIKNLSSFPRYKALKPAEIMCKWPRFDVFDKSPLLTNTLKMVASCTQNDSDSSNKNEILSEEVQFTWCIAIQALWEVFKVKVAGI